MKTTLLLSALLLGAASTALAQDNLLANGDIETLKNNQPVGWSQSLSELRDGKPVKTEDVPENERLKATLEAEQTEGATGNALHIKIESGTGRAQWKLALPDAKNIKGGQKYRFSFRLKYDLPAAAPAGMGPNVRLNLWDEKFGNLLEISARSTGNYRSPLKMALPAQPEKSGDWKEYAFVFSAPENIAYGALSLWLAGSGGELWADDFKLVEVVTETPEGPFAEA